MANLPKDHLITTYAFTKTMHTEVYAALDPTAPKLSQSGRVVIDYNGRQQRPRPEGKTLKPEQVRALLIDVVGFFHRLRKGQREGHCPSSPKCHTAR